MSDDLAIINDIREGLIKLLGINNREPEVVLKQFSEGEEQLALGVVLIPDVYDLHNDIYSKEEVRMACESYNTHCMKGNLQHAVQYEGMEVTKSFIQEVDCTMGDQAVPEGTWMLEAHFPDKLVWDTIKSKGFTGFSIGCWAQYENVEDGEVD